MFLSKVRYVFFLLFIVSFGSSASTSEWIKFEVINGKLVVPAEIEGIEVKAVLDTGSENHFVSSSFLSRHPISDRKGQAESFQDRSIEKKKFRYNQVQLDIFGFKNKLDTMIPTEVSEGDIVLGSGFFYNFVMQFDFPNKRLRFLERSSVNLKQVENIEMRTHRQSELPIVKVKLNNQKSVWAIISTGLQQGFLLDRLVIEGQNWDTPRDIKSINITQANGDQSYDLMTLDKVEFGPFNIDDVSTAYSKKDEKFSLVDNSAFTGSNMKGMDVKGLVGYDVLQHFLITIDFKYGHMHVGLAE